MSLKQYEIWNIQKNKCCHSQTKKKEARKEIKLKNNKAKKVFVKFSTTAGSELPAQ